MGEFEDAWEDEIEEEDVAQNPTNDPEGSYTPLLNIQPSDRHLMLIVTI
jgi:hypothetical protein